LPILLLTILISANLQVIRAADSDSFGYTYTDSKTSGGPTYNWIEISGTGTQLAPGNNVNLAFPFTFYGTLFSQVTGFNGQLSFGQSSFIAPYLSSFGTNVGNVYYQTLGTAPNRTFVVEWSNFGPPGSPGFTYETILYENSNDILFQYSNVAPDNGASETVGIGDPSGTIVLEYSSMQPVITAGLAILFTYPVAPTVPTLYVSLNAPAGVGQGQLMTYSFSYANLGGTATPDGTVVVTLPPGVNFVSALGNGTYNSTAATVTWNIGSVAAYPSGGGTTTITVAIPATTSVGTFLGASAAISTTATGAMYQNNPATAQTLVTSSSLPPNVGVQGVTGSTGDGTPVVNWGNAITYSYTDSSAVGVDILIHVNLDYSCPSGCGDIAGSMVETGQTGVWTYTATLYPRHGLAVITYTVHYAAAPDAQVSFNVYVDPSGYIFDVVTGQRIPGASVWLETANGLGGWVNVATGQSPPVMLPDVNPETTGTYGQFQWVTLPGTYRVHVEAPGYYPANSIAVSVPPPVTDLYVGMTPLPAVNSPPTVNAITAPTAPVEVQTIASTSAQFADPDILDTHTAVWQWGDGSTSKGIVNETGGSGAVLGTHTYVAAGVYTVTLTVTDQAGLSGSSTFYYVVVYDPSAGFVTGGGWINSPAGAYAANPALTGKATFGFVSKYHKGACVPTGQTEFHFQMAGFNFQSTAYQWLLIAGPKAQYNGNGTVNGVSGYNFILTATDGQINGGGGVDKFRIHITNTQGGGTVYDNVAGAADDVNNANPQAIAGGDIVIHSN
jgi:hypothetical protein